MRPSTNHRNLPARLCSTLRGYVVYTYIPCYPAPAVHWVSLPASRLAGRKILNQQNIKRQTGPALFYLASGVLHVQLTKNTVLGYSKTTTTHQLALIHCNRNHQLGKYGTAAYTNWAYCISK